VTITTLEREIQTLWPQTFACRFQETQNKLHFPLYFSEAA
jgi:hypothetical protein